MTSATPTRKRSALRLLGLILPWLVVTISCGDGSHEESTPVAHSRSQALQGSSSGTAQVIPGRIEVEDLDLGLEGEAYHDTTVGNQGVCDSACCYREGDVDVYDIETEDPDEQSGWRLKYEIGEWTETTVNVLYTDNYNLDLRVANGGTVNRTVRVLMDGVTKATFSIPPTGTWPTLGTVSLTGIALTAGQHVMQVINDSTSGAVSINWVKFTETTAHQNPFSVNGGSSDPVNVPIRVEVESFDLGGEGLAYHDADLGNSLTSYRSTEDVDIAPVLSNQDPNGGAYWVKMANAEWLEYSIQSDTSDTFKLNLRAANSWAGGTQNLSVWLDDTWVATFPVTYTGAWPTFATLTLNGLSIPAGRHQLRLKNEMTNGIHLGLNWFELVGNGLTQAAYGGTAPEIPGSIEAENYDTGGEGAAYHDTTTGNAGAVYRADGVDVYTTTDTGGGYRVQMSAGEWVEYTVQSNSADGYYGVMLRTASNVDQSWVTITIDGIQNTSPVMIPNTGSLDVFQESDMTGSGPVNLPVGPHVIRIALQSGAISVNSLDISASGTGLDAPGSFIDIGETTELTTDDSNSANILVAQQTTLGQPATLDSLSFYVNTPAAGNLILGIYNDSGGTPGTLQAQTASFAPFDGWNTAPVVTGVTLPAGTYWLAFITNNNSLHFAKTTTGTSKSKTYTFGAMPTTFPSGSTTATVHRSLSGMLEL